MQIKTPIVLRVFFLGILSVLNHISASDIKITGSVSFEVQQPILNEIIVSVADFGANPNRSAEENGAAFENAIAKLRLAGASKLVIPTGIYKIRMEKSADILLKDIHNVIIDGQGSELIFGRHHKIKHEAYITLENCHTVVVKDLTLDWDWADFPIFAIARVINIDKNARTVEFQTTTPEIPDEKPLQMGVNREWDPAINNRNPGKGFIFPPKAHHEKLEKTAPDRIVLTVSDTRYIEHAEKGQYVQLSFKPKYGTPSAFRVNQSKHITFDNVTIHSSPYEAMNTGGVEYLQIINCRIEPRPGTGHRLSTYGGLEIHSIKGFFRLENCVFDGIGDDNLHLSNHFFGGGLTKIDDHTLYANYLQRWMSIDLLWKGAHFEMRRKNFSPAGWSSTIESFEYEYNVHQSINAHRVKIRFKDPLPVDFKEDNMLWNMDMNKGNFIIRNNEFRNGLCHALYIGLANGTIENNSFDNFAYPSLILNTVHRWGRWYLGTPIDNVIIRNNILTNNNTARRDPASLFVGGGYDAQPSNYTPVDYPIATNVLVENNLVENSTWAAFCTFSSENIVVRNNRFVNSNTFPYKERHKGFGSVYVTHAQNIIFEGNDIVNGEMSKETGCYIDSLSTRNITCSNNKGFNKHNK
ncbi:MAG: right-handed parallel beta-helix repeat-containing protein [Paludibacter sp.]|nr:right-handed parallel beta-helix repeat-containing protein [Paludibacter sp.]